MDHMFEYGQLARNTVPSTAHLAKTPGFKHGYSSTLTANTAGNTDSPVVDSCLESPFDGNSEDQTSEKLLEGLLKSISIDDDQKETCVNSKPSCMCDDGSPASSYCSTCKDYLCDKCVSAHNRVKLTKDHTVHLLAMKINTSGNNRTDGLAAEKQSESSLSSDQLSNSSIFAKTSPQLNCSTHSNGILHLYCELCSMAICSQCAVLNHSGHNIQYLQQIIDGSKTALLSLISQSKAQVNTMETMSLNILSTVENLEIRTSSVCSEIRGVFQKLIALLEQRQNALINSVCQIRQVKFDVLYGQMNQIIQRTKSLKTLTEEIKQNFELGSDLDILKAKKALKDELEVADQYMTSNTMPHDDECITFLAPDPSIQLSFAEMGKISSGASAMFSTVAGDGLTSLACNSVAQFEIITHDHLGKPCRNGGDPVHVEIQDPDSKTLHHKLIDRQNGTYSVSYCPVQEGEHKITVSIRGKDVIESPFCVSALAKRAIFSSSSSPRLMFGGTGDKDGQLCRPWGIACDSKGYFVVADRSNNRIQIFSPLGAFVSKFGSAGAYPGQFNRPAGLSVDMCRRIVVADKDNHRIQVFSFEGELLLVFGERGSKNGQFYYPWDVSTDGKGLIAVTDTRNHRIQLFGPNGKFIGKYGFEGILWKHFDSPRGIAFVPGNSSIVVTDFNNHRLVIVQPDLQSARFLGSEGTQPSQFLRPQGVVVDGEGNYIVADSRNHRLQVFSASGTIVAILGGTQGNGPNDMDRPSGVAVTPNAGIAVVDFGNNRILVY